VDGVTKYLVQGCAAMNARGNDASRRSIMRRRRRQRDDQLPRPWGADVTMIAHGGRDDGGHGERAGAAHLAVPGNRRPAREARIEEQSQVRIVLIGEWVNS
jgi:hypothetical protein